MPAKKPLKTTDARRDTGPPPIKKFTYKQNKALDEKFGTTANSPLHRSNRFPQEHAAESAAQMFNDRRRKS